MNDKEILQKVAGINVRTKKRILNLTKSLFWQMTLKCQNMEIGNYESEHNPKMDGNLISPQNSVQPLTIQAKYQIILIFSGIIKWSEWVHTKFSLSNSIFHFFIAFIWFSAEPALNHSIWASLKLWDSQISSSLPWACFRMHFNG